MDLINLQNQTRSIKNITGTDLVIKYNGKPMMMKKGQEVSIIGGLAQHVAQTIFDAAYYALWDAKVDELKAQNKTREARAYRVDVHTQNAIWRAITGEDHPVYGKGVEQVEAPQVDLDELTNQLNNLKAADASRGGVASIEQVVERANQEALQAVGEDVDSGRSAGNASLNGQDDAVEVAETPADSDQPEAFGDLEALS